MSEKGLLQTIIECKCLQCREGNMYKHGAYNLGKFHHMHDECPHCELRFEKEPGFFYGAMYVSYALSVGIFLVTALLVYLVAGDPPVETYIIVVASVAAILYPLNFRYSRILFLLILGGVKYDPTKGHTKSVS